MEEIRPLFFATEVTAELRRPLTQQVRSKIRRNPEQDNQLSPYERLKRTKLQMQRTKHEYFKTLSQNHRLQLSLNKLEKKKHTTRTQFVKIYGNLKYKKFLQQTKADSQIRSKSVHQQRFDRTRKKKLQQQLQIMLTKNQEEQKILMLQKKNRNQKERLNEIKSKAKDSILHWSKNKHDMIKSHHTQFTIRKSNISSILQERSKLNYMKKINKELSLLKQYENVIEQIGQFNIEEIQKMAIHMEKDKNYQTFFMTTRNTIS